MTTFDFPAPPRLAVGSHPAGSGKGCAMNVISYVNGDTKITDLPDCSNPVLARMVQYINDSICTHRDGDLLCLDCSQQVMPLAFATMGTAAHGLTIAELSIVRVRVAVFAARKVLCMVPGEFRAPCVRVLEEAEAWCENPSESTVDSIGKAVANLEREVRFLPPGTSAAHVCSVFRNIYHSPSDTPCAAAQASSTDVTVLAHEIIDEFKRLTGTHSPILEPETITTAMKEMVKA